MSVLIVGASLAGLSAAERLREEGYDDELIVVDRSPVLPPDRPALSKQVLSGEWPAERASNRSTSKVPELGLDLRLGVAAQMLSVEPLTVRLDDGAVIDPRGLVIATGSAPRRFGDPTLSGVHVLRDLDDCVRLRSDLEVGPRRVVVIGAGFIGAEVAATCRGLGHQVTMIEAAGAPLERVLPGQIGRFVADAHRCAGVEVMLGVGVEDLVAGDPDGLGGRRVGAVRLLDGTTIAAEVVVIGIGVEPNTRWLDGSGVDLGNGVICDPTLLTAPGVVAAGDVANWWHPRYERRMRIEQWENAIEQGEHAARRLLCELRGTSGALAEEFTSVPWFWSDQYELKIQMAGVPDASDEPVVVDGSIDEGRFVIMFRRDDICAAVVGVNRPRHVMRARMRMTESLDWVGMRELF